MDTMVISKILPGQTPTEEQRKKIQELAQMPVAIDDECPELTEEFLKGKVMVTRLPDGSVQKTHF